LTALPRATDSAGTLDVSRIFFQTVRHFDLAFLTHKQAWKLQGQRIVCRVDLDSRPDKRGGFTVYDCASPDDTYRTIWLREGEQVEDTMTVEATLRLRYVMPGQGFAGCWEYRLADVVRQQWCSVTASQQSPRTPPPGRTMLPYTGCRAAQLLGAVRVSTPLFLLFVCRVKGCECAEPSHHLCLCDTLPVRNLPAFIRERMEQTAVPTDRLPDHFPCRSLVLLSVPAPLCSPLCHDVQIDTGAANARHQVAAQ
jgi:hypothetical protein